MTIRITPTLSLRDSDIELSAIRAQGAGGQNVNKVASAVQLRFDIPHSSLSAPLKQRLLRQRDQRLTQDGVWVIKCQEHRTQARNREAAQQRLVEFVRQGIYVPPKRIPTRPSLAVKRQRLENKKRRGRIKRDRSTVRDF